MSTIVKAIGFDLTFSDNISIDSFYHHLVHFESDILKIGPYEYKIYTNLRDGYIVGALVCYKGDRRFLTSITSDNSQDKVKKVELDENQESSQASLFCIEPSSKQGMFYSYHNGVSVGAFSKYLQKVHSRTRNIELQQKKNELKAQKTHSQKHRIEAQSYFKNDFALNVKVKPLDYENILEAFSEVSSVDITVSPSVIPIGSSFFTPLKSISDKFKIHATLSKHRNDRTLMSEIKTYLISLSSPKSKDAVSALKIYGKSLSGIDFDAHIGENVQHFFQTGLDSYIDMLPDNYWVDFLECKAMDKLLDLVNSEELYKKPKPLSSWKFSEDKRTYSAAQKNQPK